MAIFTEGASDCGRGFDEGESRRTRETTPGGTSRRPRTYIYPFWKTTRTSVPRASFPAFHPALPRSIDDLRNRASNLGDSSGCCYPTALYTLERYAVTVEGSDSSFFTFFPPPSSLRMATVLSLESFPEELIERILSYCVVVTPTPAVSCPAWAPVHPPTSPRPVCSRLAPLLVCKAFYRISLPHFYHTIHLTRPSQPANLLAALHHYPWLSRYVRRIVITGIFDGADQVFRRCSHVKALDITLDPRFPDQAYCPAVERMCDSLEALDAVTHLTIRKPARLYLTHAGVKRLIVRLASAITGWIDLVSLIYVIQKIPFTYPFCRNLPTLRSVSQMIHQQLNPGVLYPLSPMRYLLRRRCIRFPPSFRVSGTKPSSVSVGTLVSSGSG